MNCPDTFDANFNRASVELSKAEGLMAALETVIDYSDVNWSSSDGNAILSLFYAAREQLRAVRKAHSMEWTGFGGSPAPELTPEDIALSRGETPEK